jgi:hypothetical protein
MNGWMDGRTATVGSPNTTIVMLRGHALVVTPHTTTTNDPAYSLAGVVFSVPICPSRPPLPPRGQGQEEEEEVHASLFCWPRSRRSGAGA